MRGGIFLVSANVSAQVISLLRTILLARLIPIDDFGIAATYLLLVTLIEMLSQLGLDRMIVQVRDGDSIALQGALHSVQVIRGMVAAIALFVAAWPVSALFDQPENLGFYQLLAIMPLMGGFAHFDQHRFKRDMDFGPASLIIILPYAGSLAIMLGLSLAFRDHRLMLWAIIGQQAIMLLLSHGLARRPYTMAWDVKLVRRIKAFGMPLFLNGTLLFVIMNGERMLIGHLRSMADLAIFTMMLNLSMTPALVLTSSLQNWFLPQLARLQDNGIRFAKLALSTFQSTLFLGLAVAVGAALIGPPLVAFAAGPQFTSGLDLFAWLAIAQGVRVAKAGPGVVALALGRSGNELWGNLFRIGALPAGWWWIASGGDLIGLAWLVIVAEAGGLFISLKLSARKTEISLRSLIVPLIAFFATLVLIAVDLRLHPASANLMDHLHGFQLAYAASAILAVLAMRELVDLVRNLRRLP